MNKVIMMGRLTRDPEIRYGQGQNATAIAGLSIAVDRRFKRDGDPDADFFDCTAFGKQAEFAEKYLKKGTKVVIEGRLQNDNYTNKDGQKVYRNRIMIEGVEFAESKAAAAGYTGGGFDPSNSVAKGPSAPSTAPSDFMNIPSGLDDELPFA
ncbi:MAG: single-stranded DNA-binding protein [Lachnospiraceae bacterium]|nr:single-stranded DNA-binding protein [Lachnospiraceae bacterium]